MPGCAKDQLQIPSELLRLDGHRAQDRGQAQVLRRPHLHPDDQLDPAHLVSGGSKNNPGFALELEKATF